MADLEKVPPAGVDEEVGSIVAYRSTSARIGLKHADSATADEALEFFQAHAGEALAMTPAQERRLLRKIDRNLMPLLCVVYGLNFLDKTTVSYASIMGFKTDIHLEGQDYAWIAGMFYFGYLVWEWPTNYLLQRLPLAKWSAANVIIWGLVLCCMAAVHTFGQAMAVRTLLGVFEAAVSPGFALFTSQWYTMGEQGTRVGVWFSFNGVGQIVGGLVAYGIAVGTAHHPLAGGLQPWRLLFLVIGLFTAAVGVVFLWLMPDNQMNARFLSSDERVQAIERIRVNQQGVGNKHFKWYQLREALTDPVVWALAFFSIVANIPNGGITNFFSQLIVSFGFTPQQSLLLGIPGGAVEIVTLVSLGYLGDRWHNRLLVSVIGITIGFLGMLLITVLDNSAPGHRIGRLVGYYMTQASPAPFVALLSLIATNIAGWTKKTTVAAMYLIAYCVGNIIGPQVFRDKDAPQYRPAEITILALAGVCLADVLFIYWWWRRQNTIKAARRAEPGYTKMAGQEFYDLTDRENPEFVYSL